MKRKTVIIVLAVVVVAFAIPKLRQFLSEARPAGTNGAAVNRPLSVTGRVLQPRALESKILATGTVLANDEIEVKSEVSGKIVSIHLPEGSQVRKGALLVKINDAELQAQLQKLQYQKQLAEEREHRQNMLLKKEAVSQESYDTTVKELRSFEADVDLVQAQIAKTEIRAPFDGVIGLKYVSEGAYITPQVNIATLLSINPVKVDFAVPEKYAAALRKGLRISFTTEGDTVRHTGEVYAIEPKVNSVTRTIQLRAVAPNVEGRILPGAFAQIEIILKRISDALMVPTEALVPELNGQKVFLYKNGVASPAQVVTGIRTDKEVQILSGIQMSDTLITSGILQLRPNMPVEVTVISNQ